VVTGARIAARARRNRVAADAIVLRRLEPTDGPAIDRLGRETPDTGAVAFYSEFHHDAYEALMVLHPGAVGVVAEAPDARIVGMGLVTFGDCQFEGKLRPSAYLSSLSVHPEYRRRGIAARIAAWRVDKARERFQTAGREGVIFAAIQAGNVGSVRTAASWSNQVLHGRTSGAVNNLRRTPPKALDRLEVRAARHDELDRIADEQNRFFGDCNFYSPDSALSLEAWRSQLFFGERLREYYIAVDGSGQISAGLGVTAEGPLITGHVVRMPRALRIANAFLRILPPDGTSRRLKVERFWFAPGQLKAARYLWESTRWLLRERGTMVMTFFDVNGPIRQAVVLPRIMHSSTGTLALDGPEPADPARCVYVNP
jgi:GNAT superfamily N-acetyltransferase